MSWSYMIALLLFLTSLAYIFLGSSILADGVKVKLRQRYFVGASWFALWSLFYGMMTVADSPEMARIFWACGFTASCLFFAGWNVFFAQLAMCSSKTVNILTCTLYPLSILFSILCIASNDAVFVSTELGYQYSYYGSGMFTVTILYLVATIVLMPWMQLRYLRAAKFKRQKKPALIFGLMTIIIAPPAFALDFALPLITKVTVPPLATVLILFVTSQLFRILKIHKTIDITVNSVSDSIFASLTTPILVLDHQNHVILANGAASEFWGHEVIGKNMSELILVGGTSPEPSFFDEEILKARITAISGADSRNGDMLLTVIRDRYDEVLSKVVTINDLTDLLNALDEAERANQAKSDFLARISHEIRTPMNAVMGMTELALREDKHDVRTEHMIAVKHAAANLLVLINDILDFSKIEAGKLSIVPKEYSVASMLDDVVSLVRIRAADSQIRLAVKADSNIPRTLYGDETRIRQAVLNLLSNAFKYTEKGFVSLGAYGEYIDDPATSTERDADSSPGQMPEGTVNLKFEITDTGIGIKPEDIEKLFADFIQLDLERNRGVEGVGLGLAITRGIVKTMGGEITVQSKYGKGSTFTVTIPQKFRSRKPLAKIKKRSGKSVLLFEQREIYAESIIYALGNLGADYTIVASETELLEKMEGREYDFLLISLALYKQNEEAIQRCGKNAKTIMLAEFGEAVPDRFPNALTMPVYSVQIANLLNGESGKSFYDSQKESIVRFAAPAAKVLVVDDVNTNLKVSQGLMLPYNMQIVLCDSGLKAIEAIKSKDYDLVFMDHKMPHMNGIEATLLIREKGSDDPYYSQLPIVALTANAVSGAKETYIENGFNDILFKPMDPVELNEVLEKWIPKSKQERFAAADAGMSEETGARGGT